VISYEEFLFEDTGDNFAEDILEDRVSEDSIPRYIKSLPFVPGHWIGIVVDCALMSTSVLDSCIAAPCGFEDRCRDITEDIDAIVGNDVSWTHYNCLKVPQQDDLVSCGVFLCLFCEFYLDDVEIHFRPLRKGLRIWAPLATCLLYFNAASIPKPILFIQSNY